MPEHDYKAGDAVWGLVFHTDWDFEWIAGFYVRSFKRSIRIRSDTGHLFLAHKGSVYPRDPALNGKDKPNG